jgi:hypothetical protein
MSQVTPLLEGTLQPFQLASLMGEGSHTLAWAASELVASGMCVTSMFRKLPDAILADAVSTSRVQFITQQIIQSLQNQHGFANPSQIFANSQFHAELHTYGQIHDAKS